MGDGEKSLPSLDATILVRNTTEAEARVYADTLEGTRLKHFEVVRLLGRGGMGAVYYGSDTSLERQVAIKVLAPEIAHDPEVVARFEREARAQARLRHPNVAQIYFIGEDRGVHFFVMEYLEGPGLDSLLAGPEPLPWAKALEYTIAAARGLRAAFAQGFVHRDVKPSNLMLDREAGIKILDFGLVKSMHGDSQLTRDGAIIGSPLYMSPEQGRGGAVDLRSDIYSLGCALYHMLCGRPPFTGPSPVGVISMHVTDKAPPVRVLNPNVPEVLARIVERMMAKEPADRFANYDDLLAALESARAERRELSGFRTRGIALAIDATPAGVRRVLRRPVGPRGGVRVLRPLSPPARANPGQVAARHSRRRCSRKPDFVEGGADSLPGLCLGPLAWTVLAASSIPCTATSAWPFAWPV